MPLCVWVHVRVYVSHSEILAESVPSLLPVISHLYWHHSRQLLNILLQSSVIVTIKEKCYIT